jgi:glycosyltransferase involved in cell wall biosynthesis
MRVLYLLTRADLGGAQIHVLDLLAGFRNVIDPVVAVGEEGFFAESVRALGIPCHIVSNLVHPVRPLQDCRAFYQVASLIRRVKPDVVHAHTSKAGVVGRMAAWWAGAPSVFTAHTWCFAEGTSWKWRLLGIPSEKLAGRVGAAIINVSDANRLLAIRHGVGAQGRMVRIWNGIADVTHRANPGEPGTPSIVMVARFAAQKDHALLLRAAAGLDLPFHIVFVGDGPTEREARNEARRLGIADRVQFAGSRMDVAEILASSHIFALPSKWEGFPLSILEAMRAGLPVIASDVGGVAEAVADGCSGILVKPGDVDGFRESLRKLLESAALREKMGRSGRHRYESNFTVKDMLQQTLAVYRMAASGASVKTVEASDNPLSEYSC